MEEQKDTKNIWIVMTITFLRYRLYLAYYCIDQKK